MALNHEVPLMENATNSNDRNFDPKNENVYYGI